MVSRARDWMRQALKDLGHAERSLQFGDYEWLPSSDIDLLIVVREAPENPLERISAYIDPKLPLDVEPRVFTVEEFFEVARERRRLAVEILTKGLFLAGREELLKEARRIAGL